MKEDLEKVFSVDKLCPVSRAGGKHNQINSLLEIYACIVATAIGWSYILFQ